MAKKMSILFNGFDELAEALDKGGGDLKKAVNESLEKTHKYITPQVQEAMQKHSVRYTGNTRRSIITSDAIEWAGNVASIDVGFNLFKGWASIFLMYGTPRMKKDQKLYNAFRGAKTQKEIAEIQTKVMSEYINLARKR